MMVITTTASLTQWNARQRIPLIRSRTVTGQSDRSHGAGSALLGGATFAPPEARRFNRSSQPLKITKVSGGAKAGSGRQADSSELDVAGSAEVPASCRAGITGSIDSRAFQEQAIHRMYTHSV